MASQIRRLRLAHLAFWILLGLLACAGLGRSLWTPDEPREAEISREMYLAPSFIPTLNEAPFLEKPPLYYWLVAGVFGLTGGPSVAGARFVSGFAGWLTLLVLYGWSRRATNPRTAIFAVVLLATSSQFLYSTHWVLIDPVLMLSCSLAAWCGWEVVNGTGGRAYLLSFYGALALALWTKGLVGPMLIVAGLAVYCVAARKDRPWRSLHPILGGLFLALVLGSIGGTIYIEGGREALWQWAWVNHVQRFVDPQGTGHQQPFHYYLKAVPVAVLPWLVPFLDLFRPSFWQASRPAAPLRRYAAALTVGGLVLLSLAATKRENYLLPLLAPLFMLLALAVEDRWIAFREQGPSRGWQRGSEWLQAALLALVALVPGAAVIAYTRAASVPAVLALACALAAITVLFVSTRRHRPRQAAIAAGAAALIFAFGTLLLAMPMMESQKDFTPFLHEIDQQVPRGEALYTVGADETVLGIVPFVTERGLVPITAEDLQDSAPAFLLLQLKNHDDPIPPELESNYELVEKAMFGKGRELSLWRRGRIE